MKQANSTAAAIKSNASELEEKYALQRKVCWTAILIAAACMTLFSCTIKPGDIDPLEGLEPHAPRIDQLVGETLYVSMSVIPTSQGQAWESSVEFELQAHDPNLGHPPVQMQVDDQWSGLTGGCPQADPTEESVIVWRYDEATGMVEIDAFLGDRHDHSFFFVRGELEVHYEVQPGQVGGTEVVPVIEGSGNWTIQPSNECSGSDFQVGLTGTWFVGDDGGIAVALEVDERPTRTAFIWQQVGDITITTEIIVSE